MNHTWERRLAYLLSVCFTKLLHGVFFQLEGGVPSTCNMWYHLGTAYMERRSAKKSTWRSFTGESPYGRSSPLNANDILSLE